MRDCGYNSVQVSGVGFLVSAQPQAAEGASLIEEETSAC